MKWFTADPHVDHENIIRYCKRPWENAAAMRAGLLENFLSVMGKNDELFILGDVAFEPDEARKWIEQLPGQKNMVWGNHDPKKESSRAKLKDLFVRSGDILETKIGPDSLLVVMCHYPIIRWNKGHFGSIMLHGHLHGDFKVPGIRLLDVGVDSEFDMPGGLKHPKYFPVSEKQILEWAKDVPIYGHHYFEEQP